MASLKHIGRLENGRKVVVAYRVVPNDVDYCLVIHTDSLDADQHDTLMNLVESNTGQVAYELAEAMARTTLPDGSNMLTTFHRQGKLNKHPSNIVIMTPNAQSSIKLNELNKIIAEQQNVSVADLAISPDGKQAVSSNKTADNVEQVPEETADVLSDEDLARRYRSQADTMFKEAKRLREEAERLSPTKKTSKKKESAE